jgi:DNA primase
MDIVSEIKSRLNIEDVVSQYVQLKKAGRNLKGLCPFHQEKTPSFMVSPEKQLAYCFGCHKGGDVIAFIQEIEGLEFKEAVNLLAEKCGIDPLKYQFSLKSKYSKSEKEELYDIHNTVTDYYVNFLWNSQKGVEVLKYLRNRGLTDESIKNFKLGLAPDSFEETHMYLVKKGYSRKLINLSGLAGAKDTNTEKIYDRFRNRLMIPIYDSLGRIIAFGGRALKDDDNPKYLNSPDTPIYNKSEILYGYNFAKNFIKENGNVLIVEGYFDVIMSYQDGVKNVVASSGTALSSKQIKLIKRLTKDIIFCFDTDNAGIDAAKRGFELAQKEDMNVKVLIIPNAKDPADFIKENPSKWLDITKNFIPFIEFVMQDSLTRNDPKLLEGKKIILDEIIGFLLMINNSVERDFYIRELARKIDVMEVQIYDEMKKRRKFIRPNNYIDNSKETLNRKFDTIDLIFGLIYEYPEILKDYFKEIPEDKLSNDKKSIYNIFKDNYNLLRAENERKEFLACFDDKIAKKFEMISLFVDEFYGTFNEEKIISEFKALISRYKKDWLAMKKRELSLKLHEAERSRDTILAKKLLQEFQNLVSS